MIPKFIIKPFEARSLTWWINRRSKIDMSPPYQRRGRLWSDSDKAFLIDSIINGYDIPKLYMADFNWGDSPLNIHKLPYAIIDGKQRLEAIFDFYDGIISLNDDFVYVINPSLKVGGLGYKDLVKNYPELAEAFDEYNLSVIGVYSNDEEYINSLFVRLNRSKPLTGAEIRNAMAGPAPKVIRSIATHELFTTNVRFSTKRGADLNAAAKILMMEYHRKLLETKKKNLDEFVTKIAESDERRDRLELSGRHTLEVLDDMAAIFLPNDMLLSSAGIFPVYYWLVRNLSEKQHPKLRSFLVNLENIRKENLQLLAKDPGSHRIDQEIVQYNSYYRSPNDASSLEGRYRILETRFQKSIGTKR